MTHQKRYLVFALFVLITLINTAFILNNSKESMQNLPIQSLEVPPQYKVQILPFLEKIMVNKAFRKIKKDGKKPVNLDKMAKQSRLFSGISVVNGLLTIAFIKILPTAILLMLALTLIMALIAATKANHVTDNPLSTDAQKNMARRSRVVGCCGFLALILCLFAAICFVPSSFF
jgi:hypothetical protein